jgi:predicted NAD-dependent protein-ADP-ribosyltransferase YbiA (DUF1768 family)
MTESDKLCYYSKSKHVDAGSGCNEFVGNISKYSELNKIKDWRRILSNFYVEPFEYEGNIYNSVEHAFQSCKIRLANKEMANYFTVGSNHYIGLGDGALAQRSRKIVVLSKSQIRKWDCIKYNIMIQITLQRILQSTKYKNILLLTGNAELWHVISRNGVIRNKYLEELRDAI